MKAKLLFHEKIEFPDGAIAEIILWELPAKTAERPHGLKYRLHYGLPGITLVRYDNEKGQGDHRHINNTEEPYSFTNIRQLRQDFLNDVATLRGEHDD